MAPRKHRGAIARHSKLVGRLELNGDTGIERGLGAGAARTGHAIQGSRASNGGRVMVLAELVLPVAVGDPNVDEVGVFRAPDRLGSVQGQADRLGGEFDLGAENVVRG